jgi:hypothetical protein
MLNRPQNRQLNCLKNRLPVADITSSRVERCDVNRAECLSFAVASDLARHADLSLSRSRRSMSPSEASGMRPLGAELPLRNSRGAGQIERHGKSRWRHNSPSSRQGHDEPACHWNPALTTQACNNFGVVLKNRRTSLCLYLMPLAWYTPTGILLMFSDWLGRDSRTCAPTGAATCAGERRVRRGTLCTTCAMA